MLWLFCHNGVPQSSSHAVMQVRKGFGQSSANCMSIALSGRRPQPITCSTICSGHRLQQQAPELRDNISSFVEQASSTAIAPRQTASTHMAAALLPLMARTAVRSAGRAACRPHQVLRALSNSACRPSDTLSVVRLSLSSPPPSPSPPLPSLVNHSLVVYQAAVKWSYLCSKRRRGRDSSC